MFKKQKLKHKSRTHLDVDAKSAAIIVVDSILTQSSLLIKT